MGSFLLDCVSLAEWDCMPRLDSLIETLAWLKVGAEWVIGLARFYNIILITKAWYKIHAAILDHLLDKFLWHFEIVHILYSIHFAALWKHLGRGQFIKTLVQVSTFVIKASRLGLLSGLLAHGLHPVDSRWPIDKDVCLFHFVHHIELGAVSFHLHHTTWLVGFPHIHLSPRRFTLPLSLEINDGDTISWHCSRFQWSMWYNRFREVNARRRNRHNVLITLYTSPGFSLTCALILVFLSQPIVVFMH